MNNFEGEDKVNALDWFAFYLIAALIVRAAIIILWR